jgi:proline dehydrogenase
VQGDSLKGVRGLLIFLSRRKLLRRWMETSSLARRLAARFVAGSGLDQALAVARSLNAEGIAVTLDVLGESISSLEEAAAARDAYLRTLSAIHDCGILGNVSLKLTQFGIDLSGDECRANVAQLVERAAGLNGFVRVDMESSEYVDRTLDLVCGLHAQYGAVGTVIQAYLYRSRRDIERLCRRGIRVRLCKGAYLEPASVAFARKSAVDRNYIELMRLLLDKGVYPAIATHDEKTIAAAKAYAASRKIPREAFEFQMLYGIRRDLQRQLAKEGYRVRVYVPYGKAWYPYYMRRLAERPANVLFILRNLLR